jgi:predicted NBD/HSP70 family sugar kinase
METTRRTVRDLRRHNRSTVLSKLFFDGPLSRQELTQFTGLSAATVSNVTGELVEERLIVEAGLVDSDGGRPRVLLRVDPGYGHLVGVDVGETGVKVELFDLTMGRLAAVEHPLRSPRPDPAAVVAQIASALREILTQAGVKEETVLGVGIGVPGTVEQGSPALVHAQVIGWDAVPFGELLRASGVVLPLFLDNGAKTQGQAELWFGAGRGARHAVVALVGSGVGAAVITHGSTYQGATSSAGEWGHTTIVYGGRPCRCGARGCLEAYVGAEAILDRYRQARGRRARAEQDEQSGLAELISAAPRSRTAARVLEETAGYLGAGIANLINLFNPERIVLGGWAGVALGGSLLPMIRDAAAAHALRHPYGQTTIEMCELGPDAVAVGAATLPVAALLARGGDPRDSGQPRRGRAGAAVGVGVGAA